jgi:hypothetical protein
MEHLHDLIVAEGRLRAIEAGAARRPVIEAATAFLADEAREASCVLSAWCLVALPHRRLPPEAEWRVENGPAVLLVEPGRLLRPGRADEFAGVPYGAIARLILIFLQREAVRTNSRAVELGGSMRRWLSLLGVSVGGKTMALVREQTRRISTCRFTLQMRAPGGALAVKNATFVDEAVLFDVDAMDDRQPALFPECLRLSEPFFEQLREHPVPLDEVALRQLRRSSMALDAYLWLAYRLRSLRGPTKVPWPALRQQFGGGGYERMKTFRQQFREALEMALAVYPDAARHGVRVVEEGLLLAPTDPPVTPRQLTSSRPEGPGFSRRFR